MQQFMMAPNTAVHDITERDHANKSWRAPETACSRRERLAPFTPNIQLQVLIMTVCHTSYLTGTWAPEHSVARPSEKSIQVRHRSTCPTTPGVPCWAPHSYKVQCYHVEGVCVLTVHFAIHAIEVPMLCSTPSVTASHGIVSFMSNTLQYCSTCTHCL